MSNIAQIRTNEQSPISFENRPLTDFIAEGKIMVPPWLAERVLKETRFAGQDARLKHGESNKQVRVLETIMRRGIFRDGSLISFVKLDGRLWLINGYHRLTALIQYGRPVEFRVAVDAIKSEGDIPAAFHHFDRNQYARTDAQVLGALDVAHKFGMSRGTTIACWNAVAFLNNGMHAPAGNHQSVEITVMNRVVDFRADTASPWWEHAARVEQALEPAPCKIRNKFYAGGRFAVALLTMRHQPSLAWDFWNGIAKDDGLRQHDPRKTLLKDMETRRISSGASQEAVFQTAAAWNRWFKRGDLRTIKMPVDKVVRIAGTPYANGQAD